ncbi:MAG: penicillin acylase family protein [Desulfofustis sp.]|nr:penicillin acylase family protein [Desulfofustis sp.]
MIWAVTAALLSGCALLKPFPPDRKTTERLDMFPREGAPLRAEATIYWNKHQIPYIHVNDDEDLPLALGMVHAHLRLGQMELLRHVSQGRLAELFGPLLVDVDHSLRILDFGKSAEAIWAQLPSPTRTWLKRYVEGINHYRTEAAELPPELAVMGVESTPWTVADILTIGRLAGTDVNWLYWFFNMRIRDQEKWQELWERMVAHGQSSRPSFNPADGSPIHVFETMIRSGSNAAVIAGTKSASGSALMAGDPHLGLMLPNFWLIVGCKSPNYQMVGLTMPGLPVVLVGRNESIAWGGTNMLALSSTFYDISSPDYYTPDTREEHIAVRWWFDKKVTVRDSTLGPVVSDAPLLSEVSLPRVALKWRGHEPSDEITAFLQVNQARTWDEFAAAFATYAVSGQNMLYADRQGNIGQVAALSFSPAAGRAHGEFFADPANEQHQWSEPLSSTDLPSIYNPQDGYLVSTNNIPVKSDPPLAMFGNPNDRYHALADVIESVDRLSVKELMRMQRNVYSRTSHQLAQRIAELGGQAGANPQLIDTLAGWNGMYDVDSPGAALLEIVAYHLASRYYSSRYGESITNYLLRSPAIYNFLLEDLQSPECRSLLLPSIAAAEKDFSDGTSWGDLHVLKLRHALGNIPVIGRKYQFGENQVGGSSNTVMKRAHGLSNEKRSVTYGANARHISDLGDADENYFSLVGGQDGFWGSENYLDLYRLWQQDKYVRLPLRLESIKQQFSHRIRLRPANP